MSPLYVSVYVLCVVGAFASVDPLHATLALHPLALAGIWGVTINALSLLPLGRQDGARMVEALVGKRSASFASSMTFWGLIAAGTTTTQALQGEIVGGGDRPPSTTRGGGALSDLASCVCVSVWGVQAWGRAAWTCCLVVWCTACSGLGACCRVWTSLWRWGGRGASWGSLP